MNGFPSGLQWRPTNAPVVSNRTDDIWFVDPDTGWAVNSTGRILMTADGGRTWDEQFDSTAYLRCVGFANRKIGWVGTTDEEQRLYHTSNGGQTWALVPNLPALAPPFVCGMSVVNESVVYVSGTNDPEFPARMMKTTDGGRTWEGWSMAEHATLLVDTFFPSPDRGWVVGGKASVPNPTRDDVKPVVLFTEDGGRTWVNRVANLQAEFPLGEWGWKIQFLDDRIGFISLENLSAGAILKTTDGGLTWARKPVNDPQGNANLEGIGFIDENHGWVGGWGTADFRGGFSSETSDDGDHWQNANHIGLFLNRFRFFGNPVTVGYASGRTVHKYSAEPVGQPAMPFAAAPARLLDATEPQDCADTAEIVFTVPERAQRATVVIWSRFARRVRTLYDQENPPAGQQRLVWDFTSDAGRHLPAGEYIYRVTVGDIAESRIIRRQR
jgi:photosystem II stability/assembly factor-like uncharacterized protein